MSCVLRRPFDALAAELVELILSKLDGASILRATRVCRRICKVVQSSARLQYQIELSLAGLAEDPLYPTVPLPERISRLGRYKRCWDNLLLPKDSIRVLRSVDDHERYPAGGWLVDHSVEEHAIRIAHISPDATDVDWLELALGDSARTHYSSIALQGLNMLIVLGVASRIDAENVVPKLTLLHAPTFGRHPLAADLSWPPEAGNVTAVNWDSMGLCGRSLAITLQARRICVVWDWLLGTPLLVYPMVPLQPGARLGNWLLLAERTFCWTEHDEKAGEVVLVVRQFDESGTVRPVGRWGFPRLVEHPLIGAITLTTDDADEIAPAHRLDARTPFVTDGRDSAVGLTLSVLSRDADVVRDTAWTFYALRSTFLVPAGDDAVRPWEDWGPRATRCLQGEAHCIRGCRAVHGSHVGEHDNETSVLAFLPAACAAGAWPSALYPHHARGRLVSERDVAVVDEPSIFIDKVETALPYVLSVDAEDDDSVRLPAHTPVSWWEDGRVVWNSSTDAKVTYVATL